MQASLIPAGGGAAMTIDQAAGERSVAASAAELPNRELALVGQSCDGICNAIVLKLRLVESKAKKLSPGLWKPHKQINSGRPIKRFSGIASPAKGIKSVDVAIHLANVQPIRSAPCRWLGKDRVHFVKREMTPTGPCGKPILIRATGGKHWHLDLPRALPAGIYEVFVRGRWSGNRYNELAQEPGSYLFFATSWPPKK
jgi:hypothetical protein